MKSFLLIHNERKSVIAKRFISTLKNKIYKFMISVSNFLYIDILDDMINKYNNTSHSSIKMKPNEVKSNTTFVKNVKYATTIISGILPHVVMKKENIY